MSGQEMTLTSTTPTTNPIATPGAAQAPVPHLALSAPRWSWQQRTGLVLMGLLALWALLGPWLVGASPIEQNLRNQWPRPVPSTGWAPMCWAARGWRGWRMPHNCHWAWQCWRP